MFRTSLSAYQAFQRCEQLYYNRDVRRLKPHVKAVAPQRGIALHEYLGTYYSGIRDGLKAEDAHAAGLVVIESKSVEYDLAASLAFNHGNEDSALAYKAMKDELLDIARRYFNVHGRSDAERYRPLIVEERSQTAITGSITSGSIIDLVQEDQINGAVTLWEHKTTGNVPEPRIRLQDLQTLLYAATIEREHGLKISRTVWNYIRTKTPEEPTVLKPKRKGQLNGGLSRDSRLDTNWETYEAKLLAFGMNPSEYADVRERLLPREREVYFPRFEHVILADPNILLRDYALTAVRMQRRVWEWEHGVSEPVRSLGWNCNGCEFRRLCEAVVMGGDEEDILKRHYFVNAKSTAPAGDATKGNASGE